MTREEIQYVLDMWSRLEPSPRRDMVIKIWSDVLERNKGKDQIILGHRHNGGNK
jgi:hypothetical protein